MNKKLAMAASLGLALGMTSAWAGLTNVAPTVTTTTTGSASQTDHRALLGVNWTFGSKVVPELVIGFRSLKVKSNGHASGAGIDLTFPFGKGIAFDKVRIKGISGRDDAQGELGFGYSAVAGSFLFTAGVQVPYLVAGADYLGNGGWVPYVGINSQGRYKKPTESSTRSLSCPAGFDLVPALTGDPQVDGQTCRLQPLG